MEPAQKHKVWLGNLIWMTDKESVTRESAKEWKICDYIL